VTPAEAFDREVEAFMTAREIPGGALAVVKEGRIVYTRGYGWANRENKVPVRPDSLFRIASLSKPITAVAVLKLAEEGRLDLNSRMLDRVTLKPVLEDGQVADERLNRITVRHLLQHTGGWDRERSFDPMFRPREIARRVGVPAPAGPGAVIRYMLGQPLDFDPGTRYAYSNFGYCLLGRIIEQITARPYDEYVREVVLARLGVQRMRIGATLTPTDDEVRYSMRDGSVAESVFPNTPPEVPWPYGGFHLEAMDAHGGWIACAADLARFAAALDDPAHSPLLRPETCRLMHEPPAAPVSRRPDGSLEDHYYGCGWMVRPVGRDGKANFWHTGSLPGTATLLVRRWDRLSWVVLFNQRSEAKKLPDSAIDTALHRAADSVTDWAG
jgi:N-acyl-D-amino-acid deacylase